MQVTCTQCGTKFALQETNLPNKRFSVNCPNCRFTMEVDPPEKTQPTLTGAPKSGDQAGDPLAQLVALLQGAMGGGTRSADGSATPASWKRRNAVVCMSDPESLHKVQLGLDPAHYETTVCDLSAKAVEIMRDTRVDVVILDPQFDAANQGGITVLRHVSSMMPKYRRRVYLILVSAQVKTLDTYMAFLNGVNLTVNSADLDTFREILEKSIRDFNELYRPYNAAAGLEAF